MIYTTDPITAAVGACELIYPDVDIVVYVDPQLRFRRFLGIKFGTQARIVVYSDALPTVQVSADLSTLEAAVVILNSVAQIVCMHCTSEVKKRAYSNLEETFIKIMAGDCDVDDE